MHSKNLVICDQEDEYASAFAHYVMKKEELAFQVQTCSDLEHVREIQEKTGIDYLFISSDFPLESRQKANAGEIFVLAENDRVKISDREILVYKYQSGDEILAELIRRCQNTEQAGGTFLKASRRKQMRIIGVYSPVHRIGKTSYALGLGQKLAEEAHVLYLNLETFGGVGGHFEEGGQTLSDVLYYIRQENSPLGLVLAAIVKHRGKLDYVSPAQVSGDVKSVTSEEWAAMIREITEQSIYEILILDIDEGIRDLYAILKMCTEIHMIMTLDPEAKAKVRQFEEELRLLGHEDIRRKIIRKGRKT